MRALAGVERGTGIVRCAGRPVQLGSPSRALGAGIVYLSGDRARESVFSVLGVRANATIGILRRFRLSDE